MSQTRQLPATRGTDGQIPADIDSVSAKLVYLGVHQEGPVEAARLKAALGMSGLTLYPLLRELTRTGHVERRDRTYVTA